MLLEPPVHCCTHLFHKLLCSFGHFSREGGVKDFNMELAPPPPSPHPKLRGLRPPPPPEGEGVGSGPNGSCGRRVTKPNESSNSSQSDSDWEEWCFHFTGGGGRAGKKEARKDKQSQ